MQSDWLKSNQQGCAAHVENDDGYYDLFSI